MMNVFKELDNITDALDFKNSKIPKLFELDSLLRCHICKEFISAPVLTTCGHSYCSVCIRKYLIHTPQCPICSRELRESNLNKNVLLEQVIISYKEIRDSLLEIVKVVPSEEGLNTTDHSSSPEIINATSIEPSSKTSNIHDSPDFNDDDVLIIEERQKRKYPTDTKPTNGIDSLFKKKKVESNLEQRTDVGECPICFKKFPLQILQTSHIESCLSKPQTDRVSSSPGPNLIYQPKESKVEYKKLTKLDYSSLSTSALKSKMSKLELPTSGSRNELESRYNEYMVLWNANCDSIAPKNPKVLRKQVAQWESSLKFKFNSDKTLGEDGWNNLIQKAKASIKKAKEPDVPEKQ